MEFLIHTILQCLSPKTTAWNEFSSTIASAIVCLATNKVFNFSKLIFDGMIRNLDNVSSNILMYPRFIQIFLDKQLDELPTHMEKYDAPFHTKKVFANMRKIGKDFSGRVTPLFPTMVVQNQEQMGEDIAVDEAVLKEGGDSLVRATTTASSLEAKQGSGNIAKTQTKATPNEPSSPGTSSGGGPSPTHKAEVADLRKRVKNLEKKNMSRTHKLKRLYKVGLTAKIVEDVIEEEVVEDIITAKLIVDVSTTGDQEVSAVIVPVSATAPIITNVQPTGATKTPKDCQEEEHAIIDLCEKAKLFMEFMEKRRKFFAAKRAEEKRNKPPTKTQQRNIMCTYLKNMEGYKMKDLKHFDFGTIKEKFDKAFKMVNTFKDFRTELVEGNKGKGEGSKKEDLEDLWKLVKAKYGSTRPVEDLDLVLWNDLKNMFEPNVEDTIWRKQDGYKVSVLHVPSRYQYADIFTKGLPSALFEDFQSSLSIPPLPAQTTGAY
ncbi:hypothetical protein Tco_1025367 [Tanacetum coccineum]